MALNKTIVDDNTGFSCQYFRVASASVVNGSHSLSVSIRGYKDQACRAAKKQALITMNFSFPITVQELEDHTPIQLAYIKVKELDKFENAQDC